MHLQLFESLTRDPIRSWGIGLRTTPRTSVVTGATSAKAATSTRVTRGYSPPSLASTTL